MIFCCVCVAIVLSEVAAFAVCWQRGIVTAQHLKEIRLLLTSATPQDAADGDTEKSVHHASLQEVTMARAVKVLDLDKREGDLTALKTMAIDKASELDGKLEAFRAQRIAFSEELARLDTEIKSVATEQARGVLLALPPKDAVEHLMKLSVDEDVALLKGMSEKAVAKILKEFGAPPEQAERSRKIFEAISRGEPQSRLVEDGKKKFSPTPEDLSKK